MALFLSGSFNYSDRGDFSYLVHELRRRIRQGIKDGSISGISWEVPDITEIFNYSL